MVFQQEIFIRSIIYSPSNSFIFPFCTQMKSDFMLQMKDTRLLSIKSNNYFTKQKTDPGHSVAIKDNIVQTYKKKKILDLNSTQKRICN